ncbi:glycine betaine ABC transporter substrate-binding protein [Thorsellia anophelis]|uniref:Osmoprotectant transport system permease protein n=1 Tax=Thorsellia anophelis DSM 18579 TaxID=1123402 RepID=A0A1I0CTM6_9GAMM|nr:glycine betaine ABC transporter substrate-binding protein [Thorsellia anophelis]SET22731.1 osmoprotectant transport system permease protein [Thorsellia anophelis DSM 18579]
MHNLLSAFKENWKLILELTLQHLWISNIAIISAILIGIIIGIGLTQFKLIKGPVLAIVKMLYTIPSIAMFGFLLPFFDVGNQTAIIALIIYALLPMIMNTVAGIEGIPKHIIDCAKAIGSSRLQILYRIEIPLALPVILSGIRTMVVMTIALTGIATFIGAGGLGVMIYRGITTNNIYLTLLGSIAVALLAFVVDGFFRLLEWQLTKRRPFIAKRYLIAIATSFILILTLIIGLNQQDKNADIKIATKPMTEQFILGQMLKLMIEQDSKLSVVLSQGIGGGTSNIHPALVDGQFDLYPEYTGTAWNAVLKNESLYQETQFDELDTNYKKSFGLSWLGMYGFNNTYGLAIRKSLADELNIKTYSDLAKHSSQLIFAAEYDFFERQDGYQALKDTYGMTFKEMIDMDIGLKYQAINQNKVDVINIFTTDGQLSKSQVVVLEDDRKLYPSYKAGNIIRSKTLSEHPELKSILAKFDNLITEDDMAALNYAVEVDKRSPKSVAETFLKAKGLLK